MIPWTIMPVSQFILSSHQDSVTVWLGNISSKITVSSICPKPYYFVLNYQVPLDIV